MKAATCLPLSWIRKVVNNVVWLKIKVPMSGQVIFIDVTFIWMLWRFDADQYLPCSVWCYFWHLSRGRQVLFSFYYRSWYLWLKFKFLCTVFFGVYPCTCYCLYKIMMKSYMLPWSTLPVMNEYVDYVCICEDDTNTPKRKCTTTTSCYSPKYISYSSS